MTVMILAGEVSGDTHAASLVRELKKLIPQAEFIGMGGPQLEKEGVRLLYQLKDLAVLGLSEVVRKYFHFRRIFRHLALTLKGTRPSALILVDYPGFNVRFARVAKKLGVPVIYYISPQVWAWARWRRKFIAQRVQKMLVLFPFERDFYQGTGLDVEYVGHPLVDRLKKSTLEKTENEENVVGLLPGSRRQEVERLYPLMLDVARRIHREYPQIKFLASAANEELYKLMKGENELPLEVVQGQTTEIIKKSHLVLVASGTATLECAVLTTPMVIVYKVAFLTWFFARLLVRLPYIGLVNIVRGKKVAPEFVQFSAKAEAITQEAISILSTPLKWEKMKEELEKVRDLLGQSGASQRAARSIFDYLTKIEAIKV